jgi:hypothetical protein
MNVTLGLHSWPATFVNPYLGHKPKARVTTGVLLMGFGQGVGFCFSFNSICINFIELKLDAF